VPGVGDRRLAAQARAGWQHGVDLDAITAELEREGVRAFCDSYRELLDSIETRLGRLSHLGGLTNR
jgi:hypothetical protein